MDIYGKSVDMWIWMGNFISTASLVSDKSSRRGLCILRYYVNSIWFRRPTYMISRKCFCLQGIGASFCSVGLHNG